MFAHCQRESGGMWPLWARPSSSNRHLLGSNSAARLELAPINQGRRSIPVLDFMMWLTVLGCLISGGLLAWVLARTINYLLHRSRR